MSKSVTKEQVRQVFLDPVEPSFPLEMFIYNLPFRRIKHGHRKAKEGYKAHYKHNYVREITDQEWAPVLETIRRRKSVNRTENVGKDSFDSRLGRRFGLFDF